MIDRIYIEHHIILLPTADMDGPGAWSIWTPGAWLAGLMKGTTKHRYIQNIEALGLVVLKKKNFFYFKSMGAVAMETTILIQSAPKPNAVNPPTQ